MMDEQHGKNPTSQPQNTDQPDVEGHMPRVRFDAERRAVPASDEGEVEGHGIRVSRATPETDQEAEVAGHRWVNIKATDQPSTDEPDVAGHGFRIPATPETDQEPDVAGHGISSGRRS